MSLQNLEKISEKFFRTVKIQASKQFNKSFEKFFKNEKNRGKIFKPILRSRKNSKKLGNNCQAQKMLERFLENNIIKPQKICQFKKT